MQKIKFLGCCILSSKWQTEKREIGSQISNLSETSKNA